MDGSRIRKETEEKVADSKISECVWTGPKKPNSFSSENTGRNYLLLLASGSETAYYSLQ